MAIGREQQDGRYSPGWQGRLSWWAAGCSDGADDPSPVNQAFFLLAILGIRPSARKPAKPDNPLVGRRFQRWVPRLDVPGIDGAAEVIDVRTGRRVARTVNDEVLWGTGDESLLYTIREDGLIPGAALFAPSVAGEARSGRPPITTGRPDSRQARTFPPPSPPPTTPPGPPT